MAQIMTHDLQGLLTPSCFILTNYRHSNLPVRQKDKYLYSKPWRRWRRTAERDLLDPVSRTRLQMCSHCTEPLSDQENITAGFAAFSFVILCVE